MPDVNVTPLRSKNSEASPQSPPHREGKFARIRMSPRQMIRWTLLGLGPLLVILASAFFYFTGGRYSSTDDAFIKTDLVSISSQVPGQVASLYVRNNQRVQADQVLFELDPTSYRIALDRAEANLAGVRDQIAALRANYQERAATLKSAELTLAYQQHEYDRAASLRKTAAVSAQQFDLVRHNLEQAQQNVAAVQQQMAAIQAQLGGDVNTPTEQLAQYREALARRDDAQVALDHTKIKAPADGTVANVTLRPGDYVAAGQSVFGLAELDHVWVEGNFKETDLTHVVDGQPATVTVDTYPGVTWKATVESVSPASGNEFSVLPAENSSGNWVKVVQRIPVRLRLENQPDAPPLRAGMSVYVTVDTGPHGKIATLLAKL